MPQTQTLADAIHAAGGTQVAPSAYKLPIGAATMRVDGRVNMILSAQPDEAVNMLAALNAPSAHVPAPAATSVQPEVIVVGVKKGTEASLWINGKFIALADPVSIKALGATTAAAIGGTYRSVVVNPSKSLDLKETKAYDVGKVYLGYRDKSASRHLPFAS